MNIPEAVNSIKVAVGVAVSTIGTGVVTLLNLIPNDIGKLATLVGLCLSLVLIYVKMLTAKKISIELRMLERQERALEDAESVAKESIKC